MFQHFTLLAIKAASLVRKVQTEVQESDLGRCVLWNMDAKWTALVLHFYSSITRPQSALHWPLSHPFTHTFTPQRVAAAVQGVTMEVSNICKRRLNIYIT